jgi:hypothetical protein
MDINTASGGKVVYTGKGGYDSDVTNANLLLEVGDELTVARIDVSQSSSTVTFEEFPNKRFNTVMFKNNTPTWERFHWFAHCYMGVKEITQEQFANMEFDQDDMSDEVLIRIVGDSAAAAPPVAPKKHLNQITTAVRYTHECVSVLNPKDEQEVIDAFMEEYGEEPKHFYTVYFDKTFDPRGTMPSSHCDC